MNDLALIMLRAIQTERDKLIDAVGVDRLADVLPAYRRLEAERDEAVEKLNQIRELLNG